MESLGHAFFVFVNAESERVNVLYRRNDGDFGPDRTGRRRRVHLEPSTPLALKTERRPAEPAGDCSPGAARGHCLPPTGAPRSMGSCTIGPMPTRRLARAVDASAPHAMSRLPDGRRLGAHLAMGAGHGPGSRARPEIGADSLQLFADNPTAWRRRAELPRRASGIPGEGRGAGPRAARRPRGVPRFNLAGPDDDLFERSLGRAHARAGRGARLWRPGSSTSMSARTGARASRRESPGSRTAWRACSRGRPRARTRRRWSWKLGGRGRRPGHLRRRAGANPRRDRRT